MKKIAVIFAMVSVVSSSCVTSFGIYPEDPLARMKRDSDRFSNTTYYSDIRVEYYGTAPVSLYIIQAKEKAPRLRLIFKLRQDYWLYVNKYIISVDGVSYNIFAEDSKVIRTASGLSVWERYDIPVSKDNIEVVNAIMNGNETWIRFIGENGIYDNRIISYERKAIKNVIEAYIKLGGSMEFK